MDVLPTDDFKIKTHARIESLPMIAPVMGRWKASFDYYFEPFSNLYGFMDNNKRLDTQAIINMRRHIIRLGSYQQIQGIGTDQGNNPDIFYRQYSSSARGSLNEYMGVPINYVGKVVPVSGTTSFELEPTEHPAERWLTYVDIVRNYYVNNQDIDTYYTSYTDGVYDPNGLSSELNLVSYPLDKLDNLFAYLRYQSNPIDFNVMPADEENPALEEFNGFLQVARKPSSGLFVRTYRMDLLRGIMNSNVGNYRSVVSTTGDRFTIETLRFASKLQTLIDRIDITGGRFADWIRTRWSGNVSKEIDRPIYLGSHSAWIDTTDVVATASGSSGDETQSNQAPTSTLGQQAGFAIGNVDAQRPIHLKANEYGILMCCFSLTPDVVYSQGFELDMLKTKFADIYDPAFKQLGYQDVSRYELSAQPILVPHLDQDGEVTHYGVLGLTPTQSVGKRIAWSEYMASLPRAYGHFAFGQDLDYWVNNRNYVGITQGGDSYFTSSTYVNPIQWNKIFADQSLTAENFRMKVMFEIEAWRPIGKRIMPHL